MAETANGLLDRARQILRIPHGPGPLPLNLEVENVIARDLLADDLSLEAYMLDFLKTYGEGQESYAPHLYYGGRLSTDYQYPAEGHYGAMEGDEGRVLEHPLNDGGLFFTIQRRNRELIRIMPLLERIRYTDKWNSWHALIFLPQGVARNTDDPRVISDILLPAMLVRLGGGGVKEPMITGGKDQGWMANFEFKGTGAFARNLERIARTLGKCRTFDIEKK
jgi:hypothetical protein